MRPAFQWNPALCDTAGQTPGTRLNGTDLQTAAEKAIEALESTAPIEEPAEPLAPPSRPAIPPPPVEAAVETPRATEFNFAAAAPVDEPVEPVAPVDADAGEVDELLMASEPMIAAVEPETEAGDAAPADDEFFSAPVAAGETFGTLRPVEIDDDPDAFVPPPSMEQQARRAWMIRGGAAAVTLLVAVVAFGSAFSERAPATLAKGLHTPRVTIATAPEPAAVDEAADAPADDVETDVAEETSAPKRTKGGAFSGFAADKSGKKGSRVTTIERVPFGSLPSRDEEPMGVYPFLIRDKAKEDQPALPAPPGANPETPALPAPPAPTP